MENHYWAKTVMDARGSEVPGINVHDHCLNVGAVATELLLGLPERVLEILPAGASTLAALHDIGKITLGFQIKSSSWLQSARFTKEALAEAQLSVSDHALVSQFCLQELLAATRSQLWAAATGAHHGRPKGRMVNLRARPESQAEWARVERRAVAESLIKIFGPLPLSPPEARFGTYHSDLWLVAGLITIADWIGSNEIFFSPEHGVPVAEAREKARAALHAIGLPGGSLRHTSFSSAFSSNFEPNSLQCAVSEIASRSKILIIEGPMGCGKTEAALFAAQQLIASGQQHGLYFALPTQVTSNRIHERIGRFLHNTLSDPAQFRLAHGNAWLEESFNVLLKPSYGLSSRSTESEESLREARSWFASAKTALLAPYGVGTIDQALQGVVAVKHFFVRRFALAGKVVVLDEVHSYDVYTGTLITALVRELVNLQCTVIILSATLTAARRLELLAAAGVEEEAPSNNYPLITSGMAGAAEHISPQWSESKQVSIRAGPISEEVIVENLISRAEAGQHVLWIRNTVIEAQKAYRSVIGSVREGDLKIGLLHSRFSFQHRAELEADWLDHLGRNRAAGGPGSILIATQVVEQSVDIDLDFIVSDLAPTDMLLQRMGRLWRHRHERRAASLPEFWITIPPRLDHGGAKELKKALGRSGRVYAPYVLLRTAAIFLNLTTLSLPGDIRKVLEATYDRKETEPESWKELLIELETEKTKLAENANAATLVLGRPMSGDDEEMLTRRRGAPTVPVLLIRAIQQASQGGYAIEGLDGSQIIVSDYEWSISAARFFHRWLVRSPRWMVPPSTCETRWLSRHISKDAVFALVRAEDGRCVFGDEVSNITYNSRFGIFSEQPRKIITQFNDDDEFDS